MDAHWGQVGDCGEHWLLLQDVQREDVYIQATDTGQAKHEAPSRVDRGENDGDREVASHTCDWRLVCP